MPMEFCEICQNMLYLRMNEEDQLEKHCKHCKSSEIEQKKGIRVSKTMYSEDDVLYKFHQNPYMRFDPTLPRINNVPCPSDGCTGKSKPPQVLYVKYNPNKMLYFYCCEHCGHTWKAQSQPERASA